MRILAFVFALFLCSPSPKELPVHFENNLMWLVLEQDEHIFHIYLDTGGVEYLHNKGKKKLDRQHYQTFSALLDIHEIPLPQNPILRERSQTEDDAMLGRGWFGDRTWLIDYDDERIVFEPEERVFENSLPLTFKSENGRHLHHLPSLTIVVEEDSIPLLLDTGAQLNCSPEAAELFGGQLVATSFINASIFDYWVSHHPEWTMIPLGDAQYDADVIIVPSLFIGNKRVQNVAFTRREDVNFEVMSTHFMGESISGALGGNALYQLGSIIIDYRNELLSF
ncbi:hypothetical protein [Sanyastnella coralliicola]|uniref:hypothetical protein n=1 Tax=Sanyastnella coralliicola TaxID=3069118 RepID=UPI0027BA7B4B|nr:hypothetical protein [Longitalea sp. SCSIO 12813]